MTDQQAHEPNDPTPRHEEQQRRPGRWGFLFVLVSVTALVGTLGWSLLNGDPERLQHPLVGKLAPEFTSERLGTFTTEPFGEQLSLAELRGRPVAVNFWASWCVPCREEAPMLIEAQRKYAKDGFVIIGVSFNDRDQDAVRFAQDFGTNFPLVTDPRATTAIDYGVSGIPETFFIDRQGVIVSRHVGAFGRQAQLEELIEAIR